MLRGYRGLFFGALAGLVLISFGIGAYSVSLAYPEQERYQSYSDASDDQSRATTTVSDLPKAPQRRAPCVDPQSATDSDLCAQWRAARGAEKSADWAMWGVLASIAGIIGLYWQIALTREAVQDTGKATLAMERQNDLARESMERQLRAYVFCPGLGWEIRTNLPEPGFKMLIWSNWKNMGQTPTKDLQIYFVAKVVETSVGCLGIGIESDATEDLCYQLGPGQEVRSPGLLVSEDELAEIYNGTKELFVAGLALYRDTVANEQRQTRICYKIGIFRDRAFSLEGMNISSIEWYVTGPHNCADDECHRVN